MLRELSWLMRAGAYGLVGAGVFAHSSLGPVAFPLTLAAYLLGVILLSVRALLELKGLEPRSLPVLLGVVAATSAAAAAQPDTTLMIVLGAIATLSAGIETDLTTGWAVFGAGVLGVETKILIAGGSATGAFGLPLLLAVGLLAGFNRRSYRVQTEQNAALHEQAEQLRAEQRQVAVLDERTRIAREIHDVLAHSLGALGIQIQAARALLTDHQDVERATEVLSVAQRMASDGLTETRRAVHALRTDTVELDEELTRMTATHEQLHSAAVALAVEGAPRPLPADQTLALVRTAQESLTNAAKHAPHRPVSLTLIYGDDDVTLTIANPLGTAEADGFATLDGGYGLTGMRERLLLLDGTLTAGPASGERWTVTARVPR